MIEALDIGEIRDEGAFASLVPEWWDLWKHVPTATPFQSPAWLLPWWKAFAPGKMMVIVVRDRERLVALAPLYVEHGAPGRRILPIGVSVSDYIDILIDPDTAGAGEGIAHFISRRDDWDACELSNLLPNSAALALPAPANCCEEVVTGETCPVLYLCDGPTDAGKHPAIPALQRRKLRMARNRLSRSNGAEIIATAQWSPSDWLAALVRLHSSRWTERDEPGVLSDPRVQRFQTEAIAGLIEKGMARLFALLIGGEITGVYYGFSDRGCAYAYLGGFDPKFAYYSPGTVLLAKAIECALSEGAHEFHFLRGGEAYKYAWGAVDRPVIRRTLVQRACHG